MISKFIISVLFASLIFNTGCNITFKRKAKQMDKVESSEMLGKKLASDKVVSSKDKDMKPASALKVMFSRKDADTIASYYLNPENAIIRRNMIRHSSVTKKQQKKLVIGKIIPRDFQVIPLPLKLERALSPLDLYYIRVQVGANVVLMNVKSRLVLDIITI